MAMERKKMKRKSVLKDELEKPSKEEYAVARCLKFDAPSKQGRLQGNSVNYFMGSKIVDFLLESKWGAKKSKKPLFTTRMSCVIYCARLLEKGFFHRVEKAEKKEKLKKNSDKNNGKESTPVAPTKRRRKRDEAGECVEKDPPKDDEEKRKKRKMAKLRLHDLQQFIDGPDLYVWIYDPVPVKTFIIGLLLVVGVIGVCLFPLWPPEIKVGIYYLSCAAIGFIGVIFALCIVRVVVFVAVWLACLGKISLWLLPNLTEDVGFLDSFKPLYKMECKKEGDVVVAESGVGVKDEVAEKDADDEKGVEEDDDGRVVEDEEEGEDDDGKIVGDDDDDKNTNSSNGYEIVNPEDYDFEVETKEEDDDEDEDDEAETKEEDDDEDEDDEADTQDPSTKKIN